MTRILLAALLVVVAATLIVAVAYAGYAVWCDPARSAAGLAGAAVFTILAQGGPKRGSTVVCTGALWFVLAAMYGMFLTGVPPGWCVFAACAGVALDLTAFVLVMYVVPPLDAD